MRSSLSPFWKGLVDPERRGCSSVLSLSGSALHQRWAGVQLHHQQLPWPWVVSGGVSAVPAPRKVMETPSPGNDHGTGAVWAPGLGGRAPSVL